MRGGGKERSGWVAGGVAGGVPGGGSVLERSRAPFLLILRHPFSDMYFCIDLSSNFLHFDLLFGYLFEGFFILVPSLFPGLLFHVCFKFNFLCFRFVLFVRTLADTHSTAAR